VLCDVLQLSVITPINASYVKAEKSQMVEPSDFFALPAALAYVGTNSATALKAAMAVNPRLGSFNLNLPFARGRATAPDSGEL
jgi:hypothetical protein